MEPFSSDVEIPSTGGGGGGNKSKKKKSNQDKILKNNYSDANMLVAIRVRPLSQREVGGNDIEIVRVQDKMLVVLDRTELQCENEGKKPEILHRSREQKYFFDRIFDHTATQEQVYKNTCSHLIESAVRGYNATVFAYGTTGSGKTFTMVGTQDHPGIMVLTLTDMFNFIKSDADKDYEIKVSYVEIYNEFIRDLLVPKQKDTFLDLREDPLKGISISGLTEYIVKDTKEIMSLL